jgi:hypothetical protein
VRGGFFSSCACLAIGDRPRLPAAGGVEKPVTVW